MCRAWVLEAAADDRMVTGAVDVDQRDVVVCLKLTVHDFIHRLLAALVGLLVVTLRMDRGSALAGAAWSDTESLRTGGGVELVEIGDHLSTVSMLLNTIGSVL